MQMEVEDVITSRCSEVEGKWGQLGNYAADRIRSGLEINIKKSGPTRFILFFFNHFTFYYRSFPKPSKKKKKRKEKNPYIQTKNKNSI